MDAFDVKESGIHGRGLFARAALPGRRKLGELAGELITRRAARRRARGLPCVKIVEFEDGWALDATRESNCFQFVNHSCTPNAYIRRIGHRVELYSLRPIEAGEELTCDYGETHHDGTLPCRCGRPGCRGWL